MDKLTKAELKEVAGQIDVAAGLSEEAIRAVVRDEIARCGPKLVEVAVRLVKEPMRRNIGEYVGMARERGWMI